jgi:hypothetical protein
VWCPDPNAVQPEDWLESAALTDDPHAGMLEELVEAEGPDLETDNALVEQGGSTAGRVTRRGGFEALTQEQLDAASGHPGHG